jgi:hypothetical protein
VIGIGCQTEIAETLPDCTVIYGGQSERRTIKPDPVSYQMIISANVRIDKERYHRVNQ